MLRISHRSPRLPNRNHRSSTHTCDWPCPAMPVYGLKLSSDTAIYKNQPTGQFLKCYILSVQAVLWALFSQLKQWTKRYWCNTAITLFMKIYPTQLSLYALAKAPNTTWLDYYAINYLQLSSFLRVSIFCTNIR